MKSILSPADSRDRARTSQLRVKVKELPAQGLVFGKRCTGSFAKYDPDSSSWRTSQLCLDGGLTLYSETWPRAGIMQNGIVYQLRPLAPITKGTGSGLLPTPQAGTDGRKPKKDWKWNKTHWIDGQGKKIQTHLCHYVQQWPTPTAKDWKSDRSKKTDQEIYGKKGKPLSREILRFATPQYRDFRTGQAGRWDNLARSRNLNDQIAKQENRGKLSTIFVEWLMGYPEGWTDLNV